MTSVKRLVQRSALAVSLGLALVALLALILNAIPASATPDMSSRTPRLVIESNQPTGPLAIPPGTAPKIDGACSVGPAGGEWNDALAVKYQDFGGVVGGGTVTRTVYLKHDNTNLYVCMDGSFGIDDPALPVYIWIHWTPNKPMPAPPIMRWKQKSLAARYRAIKARACRTATRLPCLAAGPPQPALAMLT